MCGSIVPPQFGSNVRFAAVITDAPHSLIASEGNQYTIWQLDEAFPENADLKTLSSKLDESLRKVPQIEKIRPCNFEQCLLNCPYSRKQE